MTSIPVTKYKTKYGLVDSPEQAVELERKWDAIGEIYDLMHDGGSMMFRFIDAHSCATWMEENREKIIEILSKEKQS